MSVELWIALLAGALGTYLIRLLPLLWMQRRLRHSRERAGTESMPAWLGVLGPMMIAAVAAGADGLEVEVHYDPQHAWSDGAQCLTPDSFAQAMAKCRQVAWAIGRDM